MKNSHQHHIYQPTKSPKSQLTKMKRKRNLESGLQAEAVEVQGKESAGLEDSALTPHITSTTESANEVHDSSTPQQGANPNDFLSMNLDSRILQAIQSLQFMSPTPIQARAIPLALKGQNILARSKTGSGKTAAYAIPVIQSILARKSATARVEKAISALILVPTKELAQQVTRVFEALTVFCTQDVRAVNLTKKEDDKVQKARLAAQPDVVVSTPGRILAHLNGGSLNVDGVAQVVIDEADLIFSYDHGDDLDLLSKALPKGIQSFLISATLTADVDALKSLFAQNHALISLDEEEKNDSDGKVVQYVVESGEEEKFLLCYAIFKLGLVKGKTIIFVGNLERCYGLKLYLEQFGTKCCVLNAELPVNSRIHVVEQFNKGLYDIIIAADDHEVLGDEDKQDGKRKKKSKKANEAEQQEERPDDNEDEAMPTAKRRKGDKDFGVARGIDFKNVSCVLNFDLPTSSRSYTHRIGRTARAGKSGMALSFVVPKDQFGKHRHTKFAPTANDEKILGKIKASQEKKGNSVEPYHFDFEQLKGLRYRHEDALRVFNKSSIQKARLRELRQDLIKSEKLKRHFEENPDELKHLRFDGELRPSRIQPHMKHVPSYLLPGGGKNGLVGASGFAPLYKTSENRRRMKGKHFKSAKKGSGKKVNVLQSFRGKK
jgi:ATP-dependent RNA helicase DDX56/DBP9